MPDALAWLAENELPFRALTASLGHPICRTVIWRWVTKRQSPPAVALALIELVRRNPSLLEDVS